MPWRRAKVITDRGFASTTTNLKIARQFARKAEDGAIMVVQIPKGAKAVSLVDGSHFAVAKEREVLIARDGMFRITRIDEKKRMVHAQLVAHDGGKAVGNILDHDKGEPKPKSEGEGKRPWWETFELPEPYPEQEEIDPDRLDRFVLDLPEEPAAT